jgi:hypothetical protein
VKERSPVQCYSSYYLPRRGRLADPSPLSFAWQRNGIGRRVVHAFSHESLPYLVALRHLSCCEDALPLALLIGLLILLRAQFGSGTGSPRAILAARCSYKALATATSGGSMPLGVGVYCAGRAPSAVMRNGISSLRWPMRSSWSRATSYRSRVHRNGTRVRGTHLGRDLERAAAAALLREAPAQVGE